ncbi:aminotransferase [Brevibacillus choshinensis]|uniref:Aminotransferase n=1 Tax=Brevibacillus choshinensis TaxID=54911 RepID=A0ABR5NDX4_BRECH|nr:aspartate aminotransferase family protein [Brevibacillus choshinensis]KQL49757.1 aminotransferase [Brevibacillus choshinensis]
MTQHVTQNGVDIDELIRWDKQHYLHPTSSIQQHQKNGPTLIIKDGKGVYLTDVYGNRFIDGMASLWNVNIGHGRKEMGEAAKEQMEKLAYSSSFANLSHEPVIRLAHKIASLTPGDLNVSFFTSGGSESNDTAFKLVRHYWKLKNQPERKKIIGLDLGFHGITIGATSATGITQFHDVSTANAPDFLHAKPFLTNCERGDTTDPDYARSFRGIIEREGAETVAAVILETVQGAGGVNIPPDGYLQAVRQLCDEYGIMMIMDEIICGFGRTGKWFGVDHWDVVPDLMTVAKGITSGYIQLGAVVMREYIRDELAERSEGTLFHGFTYSGHPTACAIALKNIEIVETEQLMTNARNMEIELAKGFAYLEEKHMIVANGRSLGLLGGYDLLADRESAKGFAPSLNVAPKVVEECYRRGLIVRPITYGGKNTIVMAPPLIITKEEIAKMIEIFSDAIDAVETSLGY